MKAIILAGEGRKDKNSFLQDKATIPIKGIPMISYVVNSLKNSNYIDYLFVVGNQQSLQPIIGKEVDYILQQQSSMMDNLMEALTYFKEEKQVLIATCDIPLIHSDVIDHFIEATSQIKADVYYPIVEKNCCTSYYPDAKRTYVALKEGIFTGGNIMLMSPAVMEKIQVIAGMLIKYRKNPLQMSRVLGVRFVIKFLMKQLTIKELEAYIEKRFGIRARAIISQDPEIANDIDKIEDITLLEKYL
ncbi:MobA-like NTP transferase domain-containing protein [Anaerovirgula multivorans]|uniref:MobA-like NTP transferase domain-containing protein n=1 Tax=Anaerovirgula multivorans TaxID=312168 RepID=A0A239HDJ2_9FIRM|nr:nucleotidyltransferase family protein [Anaerovirgula multivorans]SNS79221.1 MobA-like NTP transferase domain-containing protein [Anaerovirgula multivorans]